MGSDGPGAALPESLPSPEVLHVRIGPASCNNSCLFCFDRGLGVPAPPDLRGIAAQLDRLRGRTRAVIFTAGEPTLSPLLEPAARAARRRGYSHIGLVTNGRRLQDPALARRLLEAGINDIHVALHAPAPAAHDAITRRPGSFAQTVRGLENLSACRRRSAFRFEIGCTLIRANVPLLRPMYDFTRQFPIDLLHFNVVEPCGAAQDDFARVVPRYRDVLDAAHRSGLDFLRPDLCLARVPLCAGGFAWVQETYLFGDQAKVQAYDPVAGKVKGPPCRACALARSCPGQWARYVEAYGWKEFTPVVHPSRRSGRTFRVLTGSPCNNRCVLCVEGPAAAEPRARPPLTAQLRLGFLRGYRQVEFAGGEFLLDPLCAERVLEAQNIGFTAVSLETNGRALCLPRVLDLLERLRPRSVVVRLNAGTARSHDALARVPGAFAQTLAGLRRLRARGIPFVLRLRRRPGDADSLRAARALARREGAVRLELRAAAPAGPGNLL